MFSPARPSTEPVSTLDPLDRAAIGYLALPLLIFVATWFKWWAALPLLACSAYALKPLAAAWPSRSSRPPLTGLQIGVAVCVGIGWTIFGGTDHWVFANPDWHVRDAVMHDLVSSGWPVGYGLLGGADTMLRTAVAYYLPAALIGKAAGLPAAHEALAVWTAIGATLFLLQVLSLLPSRTGAIAVAASVVVLFSGLDIVGNLIDDGPRFRQDWNITTHLEWWAGMYQYSSMTTQLFWVPNHALGGWLMIGLLWRDGGAELDRMLPILTVAAALWSPLTCIGLVPFVLWKIAKRGLDARARRLLEPRVWAPALLVGLAVGGYLALDPGRIPKGLALGNAARGEPVMDILRHVQFFLLEAGLIGGAILMLRRSSEVGLALVILVLLPFAYFGPFNDLVMRASIPSLAVLTLGACLALVQGAGAGRKKALLGGLLAVGAATPLAEFARAAVLPAWPINLDATLIGANCGGFTPHYVARLGGGMIDQILRSPSAMPLGPQGPSACDNPGLDLMWGDTRR